MTYFKIGSPYYGACRVIEAKGHTASSAEIAVIRKMASEGCSAKDALNALGWSMSISGFRAFAKRRGIRFHNGSKAHYGMETTIPDDKGAVS